MGFWVLSWPLVMAGGASTGVVGQDIMMKRESTVGIGWVGSEAVLEVWGWGAMASDKAGGFHWSCVKIMVVRRGGCWGKVGWALRQCWWSAGGGTSPVSFVK